LKYDITEKVLKSIDDEIVEFQRIVFQRKKISGRTKIQIADDKLSAYFQIIFPRTEDGKEVDKEYLLKLLEKEKIQYGIQYEELEKTAAKLKENYDAVANVPAAKGKPGIKGRDSEIEYSVFARLGEISYSESRNMRLTELLNGDAVNAVKEHYFPVKHIGKGELIVASTLPEAGENGIDVYGNEIKAERGDPLFQTGKNVTVKVEEDHMKYYAEITGYLENDDGTLTAHSPLAVSGDFSEAYYIGLPAVDGRAKRLTSEELLDQMYDMGIKCGIISDEIEKIVASSANGENDVTVRRVAAAEKAQKGADAKIELLFDTDTRPGKITADGRIDYREIDLVKTVKNNQLIAVKYHPKEGIPGKNLKGETIPAPAGDDKELKALNNVKTVTGKGKVLYYSTIEGRVIMVGDSGIGVNQLFEITGNVDYHTGNIDFNGDVNIKGSVVSGFKVKAEGNITIDGMVNQDVTLISKGNVTIKQGVIGRENNTRIKAGGACTAQYVQSADVESGADFIVRDYIRNSIVKSRGRVITPDEKSSGKGTGSIMGGEIIAMKGVIANSIGSEYTKDTKVVVGVDYEFEKKVNNFNKGLKYCELETAKLSKFLKLGFQSLDEVKKRIAKLNREKQKPFIIALKKMNEVNQLKNEIALKRKKLF